MTNPVYQNDQLYCECQLVSIWNAARFWGFGKSVPKMGTRQYKTICHKARAIHGGIILVDPEVERLGLAFFPIWYRLETVAAYMPCEMSVLCERGYHSVLAIAYKKGRTSKPWTDKFLMLNWRKGYEAWLPWGEILAQANLNVRPKMIAPKRLVDNLKSCQPHIIGRMSLT